MILSLMLNAKIELLPNNTNVDTYPKIPQKKIGVNLIALENFRKKFPRGFHHL